MARTAGVSGALKMAAASGAVLMGLCAVAAAAIPGGFEAVQRIDQDIRISGVLERLKANSRRGVVTITHARIVDPITASAGPERTIVVQGEKISWIGAAEDAPTTKDASVIDAKGAFVSPGLADMHVHTQGMGEHVLRLAAGVTTVRDMVGFPWMLRMRDEIASGRMIGAAEYVAGTIISDYPLFGYAQVVSTAEESRRAVRNQAQCGYSFVKVHNALDRKLFDAVSKEARAVGLDLVGHVPHDIPLVHAIHDARMRTLEHLKGFLNDRTLFPNPEDYKAALRNAEVWITPTFYTRLGRAYGIEAAQRMADPRLKYAPRVARESWTANLPKQGSQEQMLYDRQAKSTMEVMARLLPLHPNWLMGTDAAGYSFNIAGFSAHDEVQMMMEAGIPIAKVIRAATSEAAIAMRRPEEFGKIREGMRADLILLAANPLADISAYRSNLGVMARGRWYERSSLDAALEDVARIYAEPALSAFTSAQASAQANAVEDRNAHGIVFERQALDTAAKEMSDAGYEVAARRLENVSAVPAGSPCVAETPL